MPDFTLDSLKEIVGRQYITDSWITEQDAMGSRVALYRNYYEGEHDAKLSSEMKAMLRIASEDDEFNSNLCLTVVDTMNDRLIIDSIEGDTEEATAWAEALRRRIRFDELQIDVHESTIIDGQTFVMVWADDQKNIIVEHEPAYDGTEGMLVVYDRRGRIPQVAIKVWYETDAQGEDITRVNVYYPDRILKFAGSGGDLNMIEDGEMPNPVGRIPVIPFKNRAGRRNQNGLSEIKMVLSLQNALNRTLVSMVSTSELSGFPLRFAKGFKPPTAVTPGMIVEIPSSSLPDDAEMAAAMLAAMEFSTLEQADLVPFIELANFHINTMATITRTPIPELMGSSVQSGEALKQRESGLLGKLRRFQVKVGNSWEDMMLLIQEVARAFQIAGVPETRQWDTKWEEVEIRNDAERAEIVNKVSEKLGDEETLRLLKDVLKIDEADIERIMQQKAQEFEAAAGLNSIIDFANIPEAA